MLNTLEVDFLSLSLNGFSIINCWVMQIDICLAALCIQLKIETGTDEKLGK